MTTLDPATTYTDKRIIFAGTIDELQAAIRVQEAADRAMIQKIADRFGTVAEYPADLMEKTLESLLAKVHGVDLTDNMQEIVALQNQIADLQRRYQDTCTTDPRTEAQKDLDAWQKEASDTRATDYPY